MQFPMLEDQGSARPKHTLMTDNTPPARSSTLLYTPQVCRGIACLMVALFHAVTLVANWYGLKPLSGLYNFGFAGVHLFFVISGVIIYHSHQFDIGHYRHLPFYASRRVVRIYPLYWIVLMTWGGWRLFTTRLAPEDFISNALWFSSSTKLIVPVGWTLFYELMFYGFFGLLIVNKKLGWSGFLLWLALIVLNHEQPFSDWPFFNLPNLLFAAGLASSWLLTQMLSRCRQASCELIGLSALGFGVALFATTAAYCADLAKDGEPLDIWGNAIITCGFGLASASTLLGSMSRGVEAFFKQRKLVLLLGNASYAIYLIHFFIQRIAFNATRPLEWIWQEKTPLLANLLLIWVLVVSIVSGIIVHQYLEKPLLSASRRLLGRLNLHRPKP